MQVLAYHSSSALCSMPGWELSGGAAQVGCSGEVVRMGLVRSQQRPARPAALYDWDLAVAARAAASVRPEQSESAQPQPWSAGAHWC